MNLRKYLLVGVAAAAVTTTGVGAQAQTADRAAKPPEAAALGEVIVTAQKRSENVQKAPLAVTSLNAEALNLAHVTGASDLARVIPDVTVDIGGTAGDPGAASAVFSIRGLGASATGPQGSAGVAAHFDGIFRQDGISNSEFFDVERIEVDPGPQGTLYGRSAAAGAINILPAKPAHHFEAGGTLEYGNYNAVRVEGMLNVPVTDTLAIRAAFQSQNHKGYYTNGYDDLDAKAVRVQALYQPDDKLSVRLFGSYLHLGGNGGGNTFVGGPGFLGNPQQPSLVALLPQLTSPNPRDRSTSQYCFSGSSIVATCRQQVDIAKWSAHMEASYNFGWATLTVVPAFSESNQYDSNANAPLPLSLYDLSPFLQRQYNVEARLSDSGHSKLKWVGGVSVYDNNNRLNIIQSINVLTILSPAPGLAFPGVVAIHASNSYTSTERSYAAFGQFTYPILPNVRVTAGGRYNYDTNAYNGSLATLSQSVSILNGPTVANPVTSPISTGPLSTSINFHAFTYRVAIDADLAAHSLVYASVGSGYKPGGLNDGGTPASNTPGALAFLGSQLRGLTAAQLATYEPSQTVGPEKVTHFEVGTKNRFFDNRLQINDAAYYDDYSNYQNGQTQVVNPLVFRVQGFVVTNAGKAKVYGNELSVKFLATPHDIFDLSGNYLHARFTSYIAPAFLTPNGVAPAVDYSGFRLPNAPRFSGNLSYRHIFGMGDGSQISAGVFTHLTTNYWVYFAQSPGTHQDGFSNTTLDLTWTSPNRGLRVSAFVNNVENNTISTFGINTTGYSQIHLAPPRTYGISLSAKLD